MWEYFPGPEQVGEDQKQFCPWERLCRWMDKAKKQSGIHDVWTSEAVLGSSRQSFAWSSAMVSGSNCEYGRSRAQQKSREK